MNDTGCASVTISMSELFNPRFKNMQDLFSVIVNVTEEGTGERTLATG